MTSGAGAGRSMPSSVSWPPSAGPEPPPSTHDCQPSRPPTRPVAQKPGQGCHPGAGYGDGDAAFDDAEDDRGGCDAEQWGEQTLPPRGSGAGPPDWALSDWCGEERQQTEGAGCSGNRNAPGHPDAMAAFAVAIPLRDETEGERRG